MWHYAATEVATLDSPFPTLAGYIRHDPVLIPLLGLFFSGVNHEGPEPNLHPPLNPFAYDIGDNLLGKSPVLLRLLLLAQEMLPTPGLAYASLLFVCFIAFCRKEEGLSCLRGRLQIHRELKKKSYFFASHFLLRSSACIFY